MKNEIMSRYCYFSVIHLLSPALSSCRYTEQRKLDDPTNHSGVRFRIPESKAIENL